MAYFDGALIFEERPQAWVNGPVYRSVYDKLKHLGVFPLINLKEEAKGKEADYYKGFKENLDLTEEQWKFIDAIFNHFGLMSHEKLVYLTHAELPWNEAREGLGPFDYSEREISLDTMYKYYSERIKAKGTA